MAINFLDNIQLNQNQLLGARLENVTSDPGTANGGDIIFNSTSKKLKYYNETDWISVPDGTGIGGSGTVGTVPVFVTNTTTLGDSQLTTTGSGSSQTFLFNTLGTVSMKGDLNPGGGIIDANLLKGTSGQLLSSTGSNIEWINAPVSYTKWVIGRTGGQSQDVDDSDTVTFGESLILPGIFPIDPTKSSTTITYNIGLHTKNMGTPVAPSNFATDVLLWGTNEGTTSYKVQQSHIDDIPVSAWGDATATVDMGGNRILDVATPSASTDAANKAYVDANAGTVYTKWVLTGDTGTQDITDSNTVLVAGGRNITTAVTATDTVTVEMDQTINIGTLISSDTVQNSFAGQVTIPTTPVANTDAASKAYVDSSVAGGLNVKGGFDANTGTTAVAGTDLYTNTAVAVGDYYIVTTAGNFFGNIATPLTPGDSVLAQKAAAAGSAQEANFAVIQSDTDLATLTTVGIGNVNADTAINRRLLDVTYTSGGTAKIGLDIKGGNTLPQTVTDQDAIIIWDGTSGNQGNYVTSVGELAIGLQKINSFAGTSSSGTSHTFNHSLNTLDVIVQVYDASNNETVYASVDRTSVNQVVVTTAASANIRCLIQKIG